MIAERPAKLVRPWLNINAIKMSVAETIPGTVLIGFIKSNRSTISNKTAKVREAYGPIIVTNQDESARKVNRKHSLGDSSKRLPIAYVTNIKQSIMINGLYFKKPRLKSIPAIIVIEAEVRCKPGHAK